MTDGEMIPQHVHDRLSLRIAYAAVGAGLFAMIVGIGHLDSSPRYNYPGRASLVIGSMALIAAVATIGKLLLRRRRAQRLSVFEDTRLSSGQLAAKETRGVNLGRHLFDVEADRVPDGPARDVWLDGRTIGPAEESDDPGVIGIYQGADPLPLYGRPLEGNRIGLALFGAAAMTVATVTLLLA